ncbi:carbohydrate ABC transporter permease [Streptomyces albidoflavus]|jgi:multiple sugar transport system permease protein|uniref:Carbohydrate ABC transporter permease n=3 Tax=Streptomyces TaxID=1883 RepID=A0ACC7XUL6_9ACTN|nr:MULTISPECIES: carbohydrate ABC transporter permease [Streptomyces]MYQ74383.1 ABC transporter permease subunit [Streptomyces sp. SID4934]MYW57999.1 ABC transporter permease subunit [Streptomyces sp. SID8370]MYW85314.1 ABC transporter permease subunit [Streptomyces sp. SID8371]MYX53248.1 ABC transporter permease subunit [Streptomyces sp. SID8385]MYX83306.1 ABC transporter permease subunit [Streptomyces sp. SID4915]NUW06152.1 carbohydrate ABC transporter permease [Streptomyces sp. CAI-21]NVI
MKFGRSWLPAHLLAWLYAALLLVPLYYLLVSAFKTNDQIFGSPFALPTSLSPHNFTEAFTSADLGAAVVNSVLVTALALALTLGLAIPAAFALARSDGRLGAFVERVFSLGFLVPTFAALFPTFLLAASTGLFHTRAFMVLFLPATAMPLSVVILVQFMRTIPREMEEAARMDGASTFAVLRHVYTPMCMPGIATILLLNFLTFWNEYLYSLVIIGPDPGLRTVQVALPTLKSLTGTDYGILTAGTVLTLVPVWAVYTVLQKRMQQALVSGAVKM